MASPVTSVPPRNHVWARPGQCREKRSTWCGRFRCNGGSPTSPKDGMADFQFFRSGSGCQRRWSVWRWSWRPATRKMVCSVASKHIVACATTGRSNLRLATLGRRPRNILPFVWHVLTHVGKDHNRNTQEQHLHWRHLHHKRYFMWQSSPKRNFARWSLATNSNRLQWRGSYWQSPCLQMSTATCPKDCGRVVFGGTAILPWTFSSGLWSRGRQVKSGRCVREISKCNAAHEHDSWCMDEAMTRTQP